MTQPTLVNLHANEYSHCYPFAVKLDRCVTPNDLSNTVRVSIKTEDLNLSIFNMITGINESKKLTKHISCKRKCRFDGRKSNSDQWWNNNKCRCQCKKRNLCGKDYLWKPATCNWENGDEVIDADAGAKAKSNNKAKSYHEIDFNEKNITCKTQNFYISFAFLLITIG